MILKSLSGQAFELALARGEALLPFPLRLDFFEDQGRKGILLILGKLGCSLKGLFE